MTDNELSAIRERLLTQIQADLAGFKQMRQEMNRLILSIEQHLSRLKSRLGPEEDGQH